MEERNPFFEVKSFLETLGDDGSGRVSQEVILESIRLLGADFDVADLSASGLADDEGRVRVDDFLDWLRALTSPAPAQGSRCVSAPPGSALRPRAAADQWHGTVRSEEYPSPRAVAKTANVNRPGYDAVNASEYIDKEEVLTAKLQSVAEILRASSATVIYSGAGLSTATGMGDYASRQNPNSLAPSRGANTGNRLELRPTMGHHVCAALGRKGLVHHWLQQNHDRLAQKAGFPQDRLNEIHGAWGDMKNPVLAMNDSLRGDLFEWMQEWTEKAEVCLALGTSLCGMNADRLVENARQRGGLVIVGLQPTPYDAICAVRIWGLLDHVLLDLAKALKLGKIPNKECSQLGNEWVTRHPGCKYSTPKRKAAPR